MTSLSAGVASSLLATHGQLSSLSPLAGRITPYMLDYCYALQSSSHCKTLELFLIDINIVMDFGYDFTEWFTIFVTRNNYLYMICLIIVIYYMYSYSLKVRSTNGVVTTLRIVLIIPVFL